MRQYLSGAIRVIIGTLFYLVAAGGIVKGQETHEQIVQRVNSTTVSIVAGSLNSTSARLVDDLGMALNDGEKQRILPVLGFGSAQNISDVLYLKGVDAGIVSADVLDAVRQDDFIPDIKLKLQYIAELTTETVYVVAGKDINSIDDLAGKTVNLGPGVGNGYATPALLFNKLGIDVERTNLPHSVALKKIATGEISATVVLGNNIQPIAANIGAQDNLHLLAIPQSGLPEHYVHSTVTASDLPDILPKGGSIDTVAVPLVLMVNNWPTTHPRYKKVARFVETFFSKFRDMQQPPYDLKWRKVKLATALADWTRFQASENWLATHEDELTVAALKKNFEEFLSKAGSTRIAGMTEEQRIQMFNEFLTWPGNGSMAKISVRLTSADGVGRKLGTLTIKNTEILVGKRKEKALLLQPDLKGMKSGAYAFHIHQVPNCGPKRKDGEMVPGLAAGGHLWLTHNGQTLGHHLGDLPDFVVDQDGTATKPVVAVRLTLADVVNRAIMVHATSDDASARLACGVIK